MKVVRLAMISAIAIALPLVAAPAAMAGCGVLNASPCPQPPVANPAARIPGAPVPQAAQVNQAAPRESNPVRSGIKPTRVFGRPDPGVVPVVGKASAQADDGSYVMYESRVDARTIDLMVWSAGLQGPAPVRIQLPPSWGTDPSRTYPALFLLHGGTDPADYQCWTVYSQFKERLGNLDGLVVMPSAGAGGHTTDYWNYGFRTGKQYGTFVRTELVQILRRGYAMGEKAAVAGASAGARSALEVAYKSPGTFVAAAAYSGLLDTQIVGIEQTISLGPLALLQPPYEMWGSPVLNRSIWNDRNPTKNLEGLRGTALYVSAGDGNRGALDTRTDYDILEGVVKPSTDSFVRAARAAGLRLTTDVGRAGSHSWPYFDQALGRSLPVLLAPLGLQPQPQPAPFTDTPL